MIGSSANVGDATTAGNNVISGADVGIQLSGSTGSTIYGNRIGVGAYGAAHAGNGWGILLTGASSATVAQNWIGFNNIDGLSLDSHVDGECVCPRRTASLATSATGLESLNTGATAPSDDQLVERGLRAKRCSAPVPGTR